MKNWKTTLIGVGSAVILCIAQAISTGTVDIKTLLVAAAVAAIGAFAADSNIDAAIVANPTVQSFLPLAETVLTDVTKTNSSPILNEIHSMVTGLVSKQATQAIPAPAPVAEPAVLNIIQQPGAPAAQPAPLSAPLPAAIPPADNASPDTQLT